MKNFLARTILLGGMLSAIFLFNGCTNGKTPADTATEKAPSTATAKPTPKPTVTGTPIAMEMDNLETPSGMKVEAKEQNYKMIAGANVRADCDGSSQWKGSVFAGNVVMGLGVCENGWIQILYNGERCYVTGGCVEPTKEAANTGIGASSEEAPPVDISPSPALEKEDATETTETPTPESTVDVTDWAKYTSSKWEASDQTSCLVQIHSIAGNAVVFRFEVIDGTLKDENKKDVLKAQVTNCNGKIENGIMNFSFTDDLGNAGIGRMEIVDDKHLSITTVITQPNPEAAYRAEIMTELSETES